MDISRLPIRSLPRAMARNVLRLRTGVWAPLGPGTYTRYGADTVQSMWPARHTLLQTPDLALIVAVNDISRSCPC